MAARHVRHGSTALAPEIKSCCGAVRCGLTPRGMAGGLSNAVETEDAPVCLHIYLCCARSLPFLSCRSHHVALLSPCFRLLGLAFVDQGFA